MNNLVDLGFCAIYGLAGIIILVIGYLIFDRLIPLNFNKELEKGNIAVAIVISGFLIGIAIIVSKVIAV